MKQEILIKKEIKWLLDEKHEGVLTQRAKRDIKKLKKGYPLAYLIGNQPFINTTIGLEYKPLIPRAETEYWTERLIENLKPACRQAGLTQKPLRVLDMFAGSGCIGIAILKNTENIGVDFADVRKKNLKQIKKNLKLNSIDRNYRIIKSDVFNDIGDRYDYIVANPPYIAYSDEQIQQSVKRHEPKSALFSKNNGLEIIERFLGKASQYLNKDGKIVMEFGQGQKNDIEGMLKKYKYKKYQFHKDQYNKWRYVVIKKI